MKYFDKNDFYEKLASEFRQSNGNLADMTFKITTGATLSVHIVLLKKELTVEAAYYPDALGIHSKSAAELFGNLLDFNITSRAKLYIFLNNWVNSILTGNSIELPKKSILQYDNSELEYKPVACGGHNVQRSHTRNIKCKNVATVIPCVLELGGKQ